MQRLWCNISVVVSSLQGQRYETNSKKEKVAGTVTIKNLEHRLEKQSAMTTENMKKRNKVYLCPVSQLPSSFCLLKEFQVRIRLPKEILIIRNKICQYIDWT